MAKPCHSRKCQKQGREPGRHYHTPGGKPADGLAELGMKVFPFRPGKTRRQKS